MIGFFAKKARGQMARYIIENELTNPEQLMDFDVDGYRYNKRESAPGEMLFTRNQPKAKTKAKVKTKPRKSA